MPRLQTRRRSSSGLLHKDAGGLRFAVNTVGSFFQLVPSQPLCRREGQGMSGDSRRNAGGQAGRWGGVGGCAGVALTPCMNALVHRRSGGIRPRPYAFGGRLRDCDPSCGDSVVHEHATRGTPLFCVRLPCCELQYQGSVPRSRLSHVI